MVHFWLVPFSPHQFRTRFHTGPAVLKSLIMPFKDPVMGGCGTRQIARPKGDVFCFTDIMMVRRGAAGFTVPPVSCVVASP